MTSDAERLPTDISIVILPAIPPEDDEDEVLPVGPENRNVLIRDPDLLDHGPLAHMHTMIQHNAARAIDGSDCGLPRQ